MSTTFTFEQLITAAMQCSRGVKWKDSIANWVHPRNIAINCKKLLNELENGTYHNSGYVVFEVNEPKRRTIRSPKFKDRVVQRAMCNNGLYRDLTKGNIYDNCACQNGKGTLFAMNRLVCHLQRFFRKNGADGFVLKIDVRKFFDSIPHDRLKFMASRKIKNPEHLRLVNEIIDSFHGSNGIGLGSQISQLLAISYLSEIDHFMKEKMNARCYIRYSDDIVMIFKSRMDAGNALSKIVELLELLGLELNKKSRIFKLSEGITFLKFRFSISLNGRIIRAVDKRGFYRIRRRIRKLKNLVKCGLRTSSSVLNCFESWKAHADFGNSYNIIRRMKKCLEY